MKWLFILLLWGLLPTVAWASDTYTAASDYNSLQKANVVPVPAPTSANMSSIKGKLGQLKINKSKPWHVSQVAKLGMSIFLLGFLLFLGVEYSLGFVFFGILLNIIGFALCCFSFYYMVKYKLVKNKGTAALGVILGGLELLFLLLVLVALILEEFFW